MNKKSEKENQQNRKIKIKIKVKREIRRGDEERVIRVISNDLAKRH